MARAHTVGRETVTGGLSMRKVSTNGERAPAFLRRAPRLDLLVQALGDVVEAPLVSPFVPETIVVSARGLEPWLAMELARRFGVWAHPSFPSPATWVNQLAERVLGVSAESPFENDGTLAYAIAASLPELIARPSFAPIAGYLEDDGDGSKRLALAHRIAATYRSYLLYRPEWIRAAEAGSRAAEWQGELWAKLVERLGRDHLVQRADALLERLATGEVPELPERVNVFGTRGLAGLHLDLLAAVARLTTVHVFELATGSDHPLESSLGRRGREAHAELEKRFLFTIEEHGSAPAPASPPASLSVHACHGPMRECEVLRDQILAILSDEPDLEAHDIRVLCPDLATYAPLVHAVFDLRHDDASWLPYRVDGGESGATLPVASALLAVLELLPTRMTASQVMDVLSLEPVRTRFGLNAGDLDRIQTWLTESGIRWGEDETHRQAEGQPAFRDNTWAFGLDRLLLGLAAAPSARALFADTLPFDDVEGSSARALGGLAQFCEKLFAARRAVQTPCDAAGWRERLATILDDLVGTSIETEYQHRIVRQALADEVLESTTARFAEAMSLATMASHLATRLQGRGRTGSGFSCGGVSFVPLDAGRVVPSPVIVLLGMNLGGFPRVRRPLGFDLLAKDPRPGDPAIREDDRQLFLEAVTAATKRLVITYDGRSVKNNAERPPSVVVSELLEVTGGGAKRVVHHALHPFSRRYFEKDRDARFFSHSESLRDGAQAAAGTRTRLAALFAEPLPAERLEAVSLDDLARFFGNPVEALCKSRLGITLRKDASKLEDREPIEFDDLDKWKFGSPLLDRALRGERFDTLPADMRADGSLPLGVVATPLWDEIRENVDAVAGAVAPHLEGCRKTPLTVDLEIDGTRLHGSLPHVGPHGHLVFRYGQLRGEHKMSAWIRHLAFLATAPGDAPATRLIGRHGKGKAQKFEFAAVNEPERFLRKLLEIYALGMRAPVPAFANAAYAYLENEDSGPRAAAEEAFTGMYGLHTTNDYVRLVWGDHVEIDLPTSYADLDIPTFEALVSDVYTPAFENMTEIT